MNVNIKLEINGQKVNFEFKSMTSETVTFTMQDTTASVEDEEEYFVFGDGNEADADDADDYFEEEGEAGCAATVMPFSAWPFAYPSGSPVVTDSLGEVVGKVSGVSSPKYETFSMTKNAIRKRKARAEKRNAA